MRAFFLVVPALFFFSCDPAYHLTYAVMNESGQTIYCVDQTKKDANRIFPVLPDSVQQVYNEAGFGSAKGQFRESRTEVNERFVFYSDSLLTDSCRISPKDGWKYYPFPRGDYNARIYIRNKDIRKP